MALKLIAAIILLALAASLYHLTFKSQSLDHHDVRHLWESWKNKFSKSYSTPGEDAARFSAFLQNWNIIQNSNSQGKTYTLGLTKFADLTLDEFINIYFRPFPTDENGAIVCPSNTQCPDLPPPQASTLNWTEIGAVTPVKNEEQCGSCYAYSATGPLEALNFFTTNNLVAFSEQQIIDCDTSNGGCNGGWPYLALNYTANYGIEAMTEYPYKGQQEKCKYNASLAYHVNTGYTCVQPKSVTQMMSAASIQPVGITVNAANSAWQLYSGGVISDDCNDEINFSLLLTGYGMYQNVSAWYLKNQWGTDWGVEGYVYLSRSATQDGGYGTCGILSCSVYATNSSSSSMI